ncbi:hypothetical protein BASA81_008474 [Batrachochytrium salamandrivorans]|nr:hypothetical protein BASA81_008474 [Batrachochytrium salamandrivorans]
MIPFSPFSLPSSSSSSSASATSATVAPASPETADAQWGSRTLWMGGIPSNWGEDTVFQLFPPSSSLASVRIVRNQMYPESFGYAFLNFSSHEGAKTTLGKFSNQPIVGTQFFFRLNWGVVHPHHSHSSAGFAGKPSAGDPFALFVGDIPPSVSDEVLLGAFQSKFGHDAIVSARIVTDPIRGGVSKGYGFVKFADHQQCEAAMREMNGQMELAPNVLVRVRAAQQRGHPFYSRNPQPVPVLFPLMDPLPASSLSPSSVVGLETSTSGGTVEENTTVFVGNLSSSVSPEQLQQHFSQCAEAIVSVKILPDKSCGFVRFATHEGAEQAIETMQSSLLNGAPIRLNWGRKQQNDYSSDYYAQQQQVLPVPPHLISGYANPSQAAYYEGWHEYQQQQQQVYWYQQQQQQRQYMMANMSSHSFGNATAAVSTPNSNSTTTPSQTLSKS